MKLDLKNNELDIMKKEVLALLEKQKHEKEQIITEWESIKSYIENLEMELEKTNLSAIKV